MTGGHAVVGIDDPGIDAVAKSAVELIGDGARIGLGSGRTATAFIRQLGLRVQAGLRVSGVPTSNAAAAEARDAGIELIELREGVLLDLTVDGADEVAPNLDLVKGWGGALVRERIVAAASASQVIIVGAGKLVHALGEHRRIPVEVVPFARWTVIREFTMLDLIATLRLDNGSQQPFVTDNGNLLIDCAPPQPLTPDGACDLERALRTVPRRDRHRALSRHRQPSAGRSSRWSCRDHAADAAMSNSPLAGQPAPVSLLVNVPRLVTAYYAEVPDPGLPAERVAFGTSGHRGSAFDRTFNEWHVLAITQAICEYRAQHDIDGPLFLGIDTHALSEPARASALEVLAANQVEVMLAEHDEYTPTPAISHAIITYNRGRTAGRADGIVVTPSLHPPDNGGFKYLPPNGGPADSTITGWIENRANELMERGLTDVKRMPHTSGRYALAPPTGTTISIVTSPILPA